MKKKYNITFIGAGNTATALGLALLDAGHTFSQVFSRDENHAQDLAVKLNAVAVSDLKQIANTADVYIVAVKDDAIAEVSNSLALERKIIAHTSGIKEKDLLKNVSENYGIFYPFVSMTKEASIDFSQVLLMIEGSNETTENTLAILARSISKNVIKVDEKQRQSLHVAAVFANNFTNHIYTIAESILKQNKLSFDYLKPLIDMYYSNLKTMSPSKLQTGPAIRHDASTIDKHLELLQGQQDLVAIYKLMTTHIQAWKG